MSVTDGPLPEPQVFTWDWTEQPPLEDIAEAQAAGQPYMCTVPDTGGDCYACVLTARPITKAEAQAIYDHHDNPGEDE